MKIITFLNKIFKNQKKVVCMVFVAILLFSTFNTATTFALNKQYDKEFFSKNNILVYNPTDKDTCDPVEIFMEDKTLIRILQVAAQTSSGNNATLVNGADETYGKYQFTKKEWTTFGTIYYQNAKGYETPNLAPEKVQDAVAFLFFLDSYTFNEKDIFKTAVAYYYPEANEDLSLLSKVPPGDTKTVQAFADSFVLDVNSEVVGGNVELLYTQETFLADPIQQILSRNGLPSTPSVESCAVAGGDISSLVLQYAWPDYRPANSSGSQTPRDEYKVASDVRRDAGLYVGSQYTDCGGFTTAMIANSGIDTEFNYGGVRAQGAAGVGAQTRWMDANWKRLGRVTSTDQLKPGDVAVTSDAGHTWMYVGPQDPSTGFEGSFASASQFERVPMTAREGLSYGGAIWYTKE